MSVITWGANFGVMAFCSRIKSLRRDLNPGPHGTKITKSVWYSPYYRVAPVVCDKLLLTFPCEFRHVTKLGQAAEQFYCSQQKFVADHQRHPVQSWVHFALSEQWMPCQGGPWFKSRLRQNAFFFHSFSTWCKKPKVKKNQALYQNWLLKILPSSCFIRNTFLVWDHWESVSYLVLDLPVSPLLLFWFSGHIQQGPLNESCWCVSAGQKQVIL